MRSAQMMIQPGEAVRKLIRLRQRLSRSIRSKSKAPISKRFKDYLYSEVKR